MRVLIADENRVHLQLVPTRPKRLGFDVTIAFDTLQAAYDELQWRISIRSVRRENPRR